MHIGLIGGIGPGATEYYYRGIVARHRAAGTSPELTIVHADVRELGRNAANDDRVSQAKAFAHLTQRLAAAGADAVAITSMGGHFCLREFAAISPLAVHNAIPAVDAAIRQRGVRTIGILGTMTVMRTHLYGMISSANVVLPPGDALQRVHDTYIAMAEEVRVTDERRGVFFSVGRQMCDAQGAEAVMLGGTDLCLAFDGQDCGFPTIDCAAIHVEAIYRWSVGDGPASLQT
ncbi:MAG TPA: aspartate/glutamate racemase family protein [Acetobacteraceae bacterium]|nr:aspartate/glutamate racemase family protein [Acetobacteraceae bacterium]